MKNLIAIGAGLIAAISLVACAPMVKSTGVTQAPMPDSTTPILVTPTTTMAPLTLGAIVDVADRAGTFKVLIAALKAADLVGTLNSKGPFTVFAPTDEAFAKLPTGTLEDLLKPENKATLVKILTYHVVSGTVGSDTVLTLDAKPIMTVQGQELTVGVRDGKVTLTSASGGVSNVTAVDIKASNGVIHVIDSVLMPQ